MEGSPTLRHRWLCTALLLACASSAWAKTSSVNLSYRKFGKYKTYVVTANLNDPDVKVTPILSRRGIGSAESYGSMIRRTWPTAAITGTFFSPGNSLPTGDIVLGGRYIYFGGIGHGIAVTPDNKAVIVRRPVNRHVDWSGYETVLCAGPRLIWNGKVYVNPRKEGFRDRRMMYARTARLGVGITRYNRLMFVSVKTPCHLSDLAKIMRKLGCMNAVNVDQGSSSAFYYRGKTIARPGRSLTNMLAIYDRKETFLSAMSQIAPWYYASR
jgi:exopolysaccharide biosynthesis protein